MEHEVSFDDNFKINFGASGVDEVLQNVSMILASVIHSCPMHRNFAWDASMLDRPQNAVKAVIISRLHAAIKKYEPRAKVISIQFQADGLNGVMKPVVKVRVMDG